MAHQRPLSLTSMNTACRRIRTRGTSTLSSSGPMKGWNAGNRPGRRLWTLSSGGVLFTAPVILKTDGISP